MEGWSISKLSRILAIGQPITDTWIDFSKWLEGRYSNYIFQTVRLVSLSAPAATSALLELAEA